MRNTGESGGVDSGGSNFGELTIDLALKDTHGNEGAHAQGTSRVQVLSANTLSFQPKPAISSVATSGGTVPTEGGVTITLSGTNFQRSSEKVTATYGNGGSADTYTATSCAVTADQTRIECESQSAAFSLSDRSLGMACAHP